MDKIWFTVTIIIFTHIYIYIYILYFYKIFHKKNELQMIK